MDIVERLMQQIETGPDVEDIVFINPNGPEAADEIERLREEIKMLKNKPRENLRPDDGFGGSPMQYDFNKRR